MTRPPRPWEVRARYNVRREIPHPVEEILYARVIIISWQRPEGEPEWKVKIIARDTYGLALQWDLSRCGVPADLPEWLRDMALDCKPDWVDVTGWPL